MVIGTRHGSTSGGWMRSAPVVVEVVCEHTRAREQGGARARAPGAPGRAGVAHSCRMLNKHRARQSLCTRRQVSTSIGLGWVGARHALQVSWTQYLRTRTRAGRHGAGVA